MPRIYTKTGDDGTTGLLYGGRISKADLVTDAYGTTDEAVAALGLARSLCEDPDLREDILVLQRELFVVGADLAANPAKRKKLDEGVSLVTEDMVRRLERRIDDLVDPGRCRRCSSSRARTRRARRSIWPAAWSVAPNAVWWSSSGANATVNPEVRRYLNRLSDLLFVLARWQAGEAEPASRADQG